ncbi:hypothetical protein D3C71_2085620 [compost metagenome]
MHTVLRVADHPAGDVHGERESQELLQFPDSAKLPEHQLAEDDFAKRCADGGIEWMKQHAQGKRDKGEILDGQLDRPQP